jgi:hypothetical protein
VDYLVLKIALNDTSTFKFSDQEMARGYMVGNTTKNVIKVKSQDGSTKAIEEAEHITLGVRDFCL